jgi:Universal stress protein family
MTAKEIVVGVDDSLSARAAIRWAAEYARSTGTVLRAIPVVVLAPAHELYAYPEVADYLYRDATQVEDAYRLPSMRVFEEVHPELNWTLQFAHGHAGQIMVGESKRGAAGTRRPGTPGRREAACWLGRSLLPQSRLLPSSLSARHRAGPR